MKRMINSDAIVELTDVVAEVRGLDAKADKLYATNLIANGNFASKADWNEANASYSVSGNEATILATEQYGSIYESVSITGRISHKIYFSADIKSANASVCISVGDNVGSDQVFHSGSNAYERLSLIRTLDANGTGLVFLIRDFSASSFVNYFAKNVIVLDLTATFGAGKEPTVAEMDAIMALFANSHFNGTAEIMPLSSLPTLFASKAQEAWITPTLLNVWVSTTTNPFGYMKDSMGFVHCKGRVETGTSGTIAFSFAVGYLPLQVLFIQLYKAYITINTVGEVAIYLDSGWTGTYFDGFSFKAE